MAKNAVQPGKVLDYVNTTGVVVRSGDVVVAGALLGVALVDIAIGASGSASIDGVYAVPKVAGTPIAQGASVVFKADSKAFTVGAPGAGDVSGAAAVAFDAAASAATVMHVKFTGVPGTVAAV